MKYRDFVGGAAFLMVLATGCAFVFWFVLHSKEAASAERTLQFVSLKGSVAPPFDVTSVEGRRFYTAQPRSKPLVLEIYASWCEICASEIPTLNKLKRSHPEIEVVAITGDLRGSDYKPETVADILRYRLARHVEYDLAFDRSTHVAREYKILGFPSIFVIDKSGMVTFNEAGAVGLDVLNQEVAKLASASPF